MTAITLYHNPRCSKSRQTLALLEEKGCDVKIVNYLEHPLSVEQLEEVIGKLQLSARDIVRTGEDEYQSMELAGKPDEELIAAIASTPILMQRPIVVAGDQARIGRPPESVLEILASS